LGTDRFETEILETRLGTTHMPNMVKIKGVGGANVHPVCHIIWYTLFIFFARHPGHTAELIMTVKG